MIELSPGGAASGAACAPDRRVGSGCACSQARGFGSHTLPGRASRGENDGYQPNRSKEMGMTDLPALCVAAQRETPLSRK